MPAAAIPMIPKPGRSYRLCLLALLGLMATGGCASVQPLHDPAKFIAESAPPTVYVTHKNGAILTITQPRVSGDTLIGTWQGTAQALALPFADLRAVDARQRNKTRTIVLVSSVVVVGAAIGYMLTQSDAGERQPCGFDGAQQMSGCEYYDP